MKVKLLTLHCIKNYGSVLQTYATEHLLNKYFDEVETINYIREDSIDSVMWKNWTKSNKLILRIVKKIILLPVYLKTKSVFNGFLKEKINLTEKKYFNDDDFNKFPLEAEAFCIGSDQVWNSSWNQGVLPAMYLDFVPKNTMKFALCSSFGKTELEESEKSQIKNYLKSFDAISVRELSALLILNEMDINDGIHLLDPTLLVGPDLWTSLIEKRMIKEDYVLVYQLNPNKEFDEYAYKFAKKKGLKLVFIGMRMKDLLKNGKVFLIPNVYQFLSLIKYASFVITDSFHGTAFSINFNKQFISIYPNEFSTRLQSILEWANLMERHLESYDNLEIADNEIDYNDINIKLQNESKKANEFLSTLLDKKSSNNGGI